jgi:hypothetical protein
MVERTGSQFQADIDDEETEESGKKSRKFQFKFFKNQEIPEFFYNLETNEYLKQPTLKSQQEDYVDFNITLVDNGDDKVCLQGKNSFCSLMLKVNLTEHKSINLVCQMFIPVFEPTKVLFAGMF